MMSNISMYNLIYNLNAALFVVLVIVINAVFQSLYEMSQTLMYVICGLLLVALIEIFIGYIIKRKNKKEQSVLYFHSIFNFFFSL